VTTNSKRPSVQGFAAVEVVCGKPCCQDVGSLGGKRVLTKDAPMLPLKNCTMQDKCTCKFRKFNDRRQPDAERRALGGLRHSIRSSWYSGDERRDHTGRRDTDLE
jgi:hypothetical protein